MALVDAVAVFEARLVDCQFTSVHSTARCMSEHGVYHSSSLLSLQQGCGRLIFSVMAMLESTLRLRLHSPFQVSCIIPCLNNHCGTVL